MQITGNEKATDCLPGSVRAVRKKKNPSKKMSDKLGNARLFASAHRAEIVDVMR